VTTDAAADVDAPFSALPLAPFVALSRTSSASGSDLTDAHTHLPHPPHPLYAHPNASMLHAHLGSGANTDEKALGTRRAGRGWSGAWNEADYRDVVRRLRALRA
jgi:hypothetical protein